MTDPQRLAEQLCERFDVEILRAARLDEPPPEALARHLANLGLARGSTLHSPAASTQAAPLGSSALAMKTVGGALIAVLVGAGIVRWAREDGVGNRVQPTQTTEEAGDFRNPITDPAMPAATPMSTTLLPTDGTPATETAPNEVRPLDRVRPKHPAMGGLSKAVSPPAAAASGVNGAPVTLSDELHLLDTVRQSLAERQPAKALQLLEEHDHRFRSAWLAPEALVLKVEAMIQQHRILEARQLTSDFLRREPQSPHAGRLRSLLAGAMNP